MPLPSTASTSYTSRPDASSVGASLIGFTNPCTRNLFQVLDWPIRPPAKHVVVMPLYGGTGHDDLLLFVRTDGTPDITDVPESTLSRLACHWLLSQIPDSHIVEVARLLAATRQSCAEGNYASRLSSRPVSGPVAGITTGICPATDSDEELILYDERPDRRTIQWILGLSKKKK